MTYTLLRSLYFGRGANADITSRSDRARLHVETPLDEFIPRVLRSGQDVVLTGNPGDGKSHLAKALVDRRELSGVEVEFDLSARTTAAVIERWSSAVARGASLLLCANEGPLIGLMHALKDVSTLADRGKELSAQLGHLVCARPDDLPPAPRAVTLIDLADRNVVDRRLVSRCLERVCSYDYMPDLGAESAETSSGTNLALFIHVPEARERLGALLEVAGRRRGTHVTFRQLWGTIAYALTADKDEQKLRHELGHDRAGLGTLPLDNLCDGRGRGPLIEALRDLADPADVPVPDLDEAIWSAGQPRKGAWLSEEVFPSAPAALWAEGDRKRALSAFRSLKRHATLAHEEGARVIDVLLKSDPHLPSTRADAELREELVAGLRALYLSPSQQAQSPEWLRDGVPLWVSNTYKDIPAEERPHVATDAVHARDLALLRPLRAPWLEGALGPAPEAAWLQHAPSGVTLRIDAPIVRALSLAARSDGPITVPESVSRFLARVAGAIEGGASRRFGEDHFTVLDRPRGRLVASGTVRQLINAGAEYAGD